MMVKYVWIGIAVVRVVKPISSIGGRMDTEVFGDYYARCFAYLATQIISTVTRGLLPPEAMRAVTALLNFSNLAHLPFHTESTLEDLDRELAAFHAHLHAFLPARATSTQHFNLPKVHMLSHYRSCIERLGSVDGFNSEHTERCHIVMVKCPYRESNHSVDADLQMLREVQYRDSLQTKRYYLEEQGLIPKKASVVTAEGDLSAIKATALFSKSLGKPLLVAETAANTELDDLDQQVRMYLWSQQNPTKDTTALERSMTASSLPPWKGGLTRYAGFHRRFQPFGSTQQIIHHQIRARPADAETKTSAIYDTVAILDQEDQRFGADRYQFAQVQAIFAIQEHRLDKVIWHEVAYVRWFRKAGKDEPTQMRILEWKDKRPHTPCIVNIASVERLAHIAPVNPDAPTLTSISIDAPSHIKLKPHTKFFLNRYSDTDAFLRFY